MDTIKRTVEDGVAWITMNRPDKLNAFNKQMHAELKETLKQVKKDNEVRAVVLTGEGRAFCSGQDLADVGEDADFSEILRKRYNPLIESITSLEKPVIAAVNGTAAGAGMSLALACDFRLAHEKASFIEAFINIGLVPDSGSLYFLPRLVGHAKAMELAVLGEKVRADEAEKLGLVTKVIPDAEWEEAVKAFAERLANMPTKAIGLIKRYMNKSWENDLSEVLENEADAQQIAGYSADYKEGVQAFLEKRKPKFTGK
ncbi:MAG TPA: enoyl-CoA hydratase-related protein [Bacillales bacterium]|nr:enoyl-CoA hydratase-related protein [Bacillales bacterium]